MEGIRGIAEICNADLKGLKLNSRELEFYPKELEAKDLRIKISTAGSIGLVLQAILLVTSQLRKPIKIEIDGGGTWNKWAPPVIYLEKVLFPLLGEESEIKIIREGFYPRGGAKVEVVAKPLKLKKIEILEKGKIKEIFGFSISSNHLRKAKVTERLANRTRELIREKFNKEVKMEEKYVDSYSPGCGILLVMKTENSIIGSDSLGELGKPAEDVAKDAVKNLMFEYANGAVDRHAADMLLPYMALCKEGEIRTSEITHHIRMNASVIEKFLPVNFKIDEKEKVITVLG
jgi:RNA 3'-terminal phosphate cyclase (ATP)/RNA 3'-terminal phosphate cyclase (GTP)